MPKRLEKNTHFILVVILLPEKKVIFVDADNTLWGGVIGEDGYQGVKVSHEYPGSLYYYFQLSLLRLKKTGVVLCLVTKNNHSDIEEMFLKRDMPLSLDDFVAVKANWDRKSENISDLLNWLNLGSSSAIFIDDNPFEIEEVSRIHHQITCLTFNPDDFEDVNNYLGRLSDLYAHYLTDEDKTKATSYIQEGHRKSLLETSANIDDYIRSLSINMTVHLNDLSLAPRISQLTQKTNQFNLTTHRYSLSEIEDLMENELVYAFSIDDKFGSMGVIGVVILIGNKVDTFLLSCRAFGREIERSMLSLVIQSCNNFPLYSQYSPTSKNAMTEDFYTSNGFEIDSSKNNTVNYRIDQKPEPLEHLLEKNNMELVQIREVALQAFLNIKDELEVNIDVEIDDDTNVLELLDSMDIVSLIMETEGLVEKEFGRYIALANEETFASDSSPLRSFSSWVTYIIEMSELNDDS